MGFATGGAEVQDLKEYFRRPRLILSGTAATSRSNLFNLNLTRDLIFGTYFPGGFVRLEGVHAIRFTMKFSMTIAANPFHQGLLALSWQYDADNTSLDQYSRGLSQALCTQLPHVRCDIAEHTMISLDIPYLQDIDFVPLDGTSITPLGSLCLNQLLPTPVLANSGPPTWKLFFHLEDLELIGSAPINHTTVLPQSGLVRSATIAAKKISSAEKELRESKIISKVTAGAAKVARAVSWFPPLSAVGGTAAWALSAMSKTASALGYSKPRDETQPSRMYKSDYVGEVNLDLPNEAFCLAPFATNKLRVDSTMGATDVDEMVLSDLFGRDSQIFVGDMTTADSTGARLYATRICPNYFWFKTNTGRPGGNTPFPASGTLTTNSIQPSIICYLAQFFRQWRGGLKFKFTFSKTKFHAGRVIVGFVPTSDLNPGYAVPSSTVQALEVVGGLPQPFSYSQTFDLRDGNEFEFEVDYISPQLYLGVNSSSGGLTMTVLDPLIANGEASTSVSYMVEVSAKDDFELSFPSAPNIAAVTGNSAVAFFQSGLGIQNNRAPDEYAPGEHILSAKQIMMLPNYTTVDVPNAVISKTNLPFFSYLPRLVPSIPQAVPTQAFFACSRAGLISAMYAFWNGATAYHVYKDGDSPAVSSWINYNNNDGGGTPVTNAASMYNHTSLTPANMLYTNLSAAHYEAPTYSKYARVSNRTIYPNSGLVRYFGPGLFSMQSDFTSTSAQPVLSVRNTSGNPKRLVLSVAAAEDARCTTFIGVPPIFLFQSTQVVSPEQSSLSY